MNICLKYIIRYLEENMKKSFIIAAIALVVGTLSMPVKAAEDVLIVNLH